MKTKYITIKHPQHASEDSITSPLKAPTCMEVLIMFPEYITHKDFFDDYDVHGEIVSAGFIVITDGEFICHGESVSLDVKSRPEDSALANDMFGRD